MKLYQDERAVNPRRVRIFAAEKGLELELENIDIFKADHMTDDFSGMNPMQRVPVLELDDGTAISESVAICRYFEALKPEPPLMGGDPVEQAMVEMWNRRIELGLLDAIINCFRHGHPMMAELEDPQIKDWSVVNQGRASAVLEFLEGDMADRPFIAGERFSIADITCLCAVDFLKAARLELTDDHVNLKRWHGEVSARPSAAA
ncbi:MAG: glutathione S-transferase family protein [Hyphomicrobiales bacterium]